MSSKRMPDLPDIHFSALFYLIPWFLSSFYSIVRSRVREKAFSFAQKRRNTVKSLILAKKFCFFVSLSEELPLIFQMDTLDYLEEEFSGMARCPYDAKHANVALFAGKMMEINFLLSVLQPRHGITLCLLLEPRMPKSKSVKRSEQCLKKEGIRKSLAKKNPSLLWN